MILLFPFPWDPNHTKYLLAKVALTTLFVLLLLLLQLDCLLLLLRDSNSLLWDIRINALIEDTIIDPLCKCPWNTCQVAVLSVVLGTGFNFNTSFIYSPLLMINTEKINGTVFQKLALLTNSYHRIRKFNNWIGQSQSRRKLTMNSERHLNFWYHVLIRIDLFDRLLTCEDTKLFFWSCAVLWSFDWDNKY